MITRLRIATCLLALTSTLACSSDRPNAAQAASVGGSAPTSASAEAKQIFSMRCAPCHGNEGRGDGPASAALNPHPRNFSDTTWQQQASDEHIMKIIQLGGVAVGKSAAMPPNPDLTDKPQLLAALKDHIRGLAP